MIMMKKANKRFIDNPPLFRPSYINITPYMYSLGRILMKLMSSTLSLTDELKTNESQILLLSKYKNTIDNPFKLNTFFTIILDLKKT
jgi:hypothetical protein